MKKDKLKFLNRFTTVPFLIDLLHRKQLTLLNPSSWEDYNDRVTMELYRQKKGKEGIYALCLTGGRETIHHWNTFADGTSGCCIEFHYDELIKHLSKDKSVVYSETEYVRIGDMDDIGSEIEKLPFIKRAPFEPENEFRIVALSSEDQKVTYDIPIELKAIKRITISNKLPKSVFESIQMSLEKSFPDYLGEISHSTMFNNIRWVNHFERRFGS